MNPMILFRRKNPQFLGMPRGGKSCMVVMLSVQSTKRTDFVHDGLPTPKDIYFLHGHILCNISIDIKVYEVMIMVKAN